METLQTRCCIAGGGPAGMMLGYLLARAGVDVIVLEKHADFLRDFRGDTVHPSTLDIMAELGVLNDFLKLPHTELRQIGGRINGIPATIADLRHLPTRCKFVAFIPQWDFLNFLAERGKRYPGFRVLMRGDVSDLIVEGDRIAGVHATTPDGPVAIRADLVVGADGRHSTVRERAGLIVQDFGAPIDVLWMRLPKKPGDQGSVLGYFESGRLLVTLDRGDYWQCALVIPKGGYDALRAQDINVVRAEIAGLAPFLSDRTADLHWEDVRLLTVVVDRLRTWHRAGLLCIGDAAHAMSPMGGVGINLAVQDAVAAANILAAPLAARTVSERNLHAVQQRRMFPIRVTQAAQVFDAARIFGGIAPGAPPPPTVRNARLPWPIRLLQTFPYLQRFPALFIGVGVRPEHVHTPDAATPKSA